VTVGDRAQSRSGGEKGKKVVSLDPENPQLASIIEEKKKRVKLSDDRGMGRTKKSGRREEFN